jgi:hypothetical protein
MRYRYGALIFRPGGGAPPVWNDDTNSWSGGQGNQIVYEDKVLCQDVGEVHPRASDGMPHLESDATLFLRDKSKITAIQPLDAVIVTYPNGTQADGQVLFARELDAAVLVKYL